jgi:hypothetical protein
VKSCPELPVGRKWVELAGIGYYHTGPIKGGLSGQSGSVAVDAEG